MRISYATLVICACVCVFDAAPALFRDDSRNDKRGRVVSHLQEKVLSQQKRGPGSSNLKKNGLHQSLHGPAKRGSVDHKGQEFHQSLYGPALKSRGVIPATIKKVNKKKENDDLSRRDYVAWGSSGGSWGDDDDPWGTSWDDPWDDDGYGYGYSSWDDDWKKKRALEMGKRKSNNEQASKRPSKDSNMKESRKALDIGERDYLGTILATNHAGGNTADDNFGSSDISSDYPYFPTWMYDENEDDDEYYGYYYDDDERDRDALKHRSLKDAEDLDMIKHNMKFDRRLLKKESEKALDIGQRDYFGSVLGGGGGGSGPSGHVTYSSQGSSSSSYESPIFPSWFYDQYEDDDDNYYYLDDDGYYQYYEYYDDDDDNAVEGPKRRSPKDAEDRAMMKHNIKFDRKAINRMNTRSQKDTTDKGKRKAPTKQFIWQ